MQTTSLLRKSKPPLTRGLGLKLCPGCNRQKGEGAFKYTASINGLKVKLNSELCGSCR